MGIVNVTPDSFSDGGKFIAPADAAAQARRLVADGAAILDFGAEASSFFRPGVVPVAPEEQLARIIPVLELLEDLRGQVAFSIDTRSAKVARAVIPRGVQIINDISAGRHDRELLPVVAGMGASVVLMHMSPGFPDTPAEDDDDIVATVRTALADAHLRAGVLGIPEDRMALDPGIGFGKTMADNWRLALRPRETLLPGMRCGMVLGASRKRFLETAPPADVEVPAGWDHLLEKLRPHATHPRDPTSAGLTAFTARQGVPIHRVHDVGLARRAIGIGG